MMLASYLRKRREEAFFGRLSRGILKKSTLNSL